MSELELDLGSIRVEAAENPGSSVAVLLAEVDRLRADLADAHERIDNALLALDAWGPIEDADEDVKAVYAALSAGGGDPAGGDKR